MRVPALCYHRIEVPPPDREHDANFVTPRQFRAHIELLASLGCNGVTATDIARWQRGELELPRRPVAITFDDAYSSVADTAIPVLDEFGWKCTIYVVSSQLGGTNAWDDGAPPTTLMDCATLRALAEAGHEVGSHSRGHTRIKRLGPLEAGPELAGSREDLEQTLGRRVTSFAFPYGSHDLEALQLLQESGYESACTLKRWANSRDGNPLRLGRMSVGGALSTWQFGLKLAKMYVTPARK
jgi:peptidoglycan/xylan/chitin deacetylase (PgdA/CDA1 family)